MRLVTIGVRLLLGRVTMTKITEKLFEDNLKRQIKEYWKEAHVRKINTPFTVGVPDLCIKLPHYHQTFWIELKVYMLPPLDKSPDYAFRVNWSQLQRSYICKEVKAGGIAGCLLLLQEWHSNTTYLVPLSYTDFLKPNLSTVRADQMMKMGVHGYRYTRNKEQLDYVFKTFHDGAIDQHDD